MRFSNIQDDPLNYNFNTILEELENYFTVYVHRYPFIAYINTDQLTLTLNVEYCLTIRGDEVTYERNGNRQLTFLKKENNLINLRGFVLWDLNYL